MAERMPQILARLAQAGWVRLIAVATAFQLAFWALFVPTFISPPIDRPEFVEIESFASAQLDGYGRASIDAAQFADGPPGRELREAGYHAIRITFSLDEIPPEGLALLDNSGGDNSRHYVNGAMIRAPGSMAIGGPTYHGLVEDIEHISPGLLRKGSNTLESVYVIDMPREVALLPPLLGDYREISDAFGWKAFLLTDYRGITTVIVLIVALFAGLAALRSRNRDVPLWLFLAAASWSLYSLFFVWPGLPFAGFGRGFYYAGVTMFLALAWAIFADAWSGRRLRYYREGVALVFGAGVLWSAYWMAVDRGPQAFGWVEDAVEWVGISLSLATILRLVLHFVRHPGETRHVEAGALVLLASLMTIHLYTIITTEAFAPYLATTQPIILLVLIGAFFLRNFELFRSREQLNAELESQLVARTAQLEEAHTREKLFLREQAHQEERHRIMRDMHDGMGSNLMSMLLAARRGKVDAGSVARGIQTVIDEMRLMIDSMDSVGESLASALVLFRERAQARVSEAGFGFEWSDESGGHLPELDARQVLQVFRILQEAITNAIKHSDGNAVRVVVRSAELQVIDNGSGFEGPRHGGRGLDNMEARARSIGGSFGIAHAGGETVAHIGLPGDRPGDGPGD